MITPSGWLVEVWRDKFFFFFHDQTFLDRAREAVPWDLDESVKSLEAACRVFGKYGNIIVVAESPDKVVCLKNRFTGILDVSDEYVDEAIRYARRTNGWLDVTIEVF